MPSADDDQKVFGDVADNASRKGLIVLMPLPAEEPLQHKGIAWLESSETRLTARGRLVVAMLLAVLC